MTDKTREVYKESGHRLTELNPFVEMPRMRIDAVNRLNELIKRDIALPVLESDGDIIRCGACGLWTSKRAFCSHCGQRQDLDHIAF